MDKAELRKLPCTAPEWMLEKAQDTEKDTFLLRRTFGEIKTYEIYLTQDLRKGEISPELIVFRDKHTWINYNRTQDKWLTGKLENTHIMMEKEGRIHYSAYYIDQYQILGNLRKWQNKIGNKRYKERKQKEQKKTDEVMKQVPPLPEDFEDFIENNLMKNANYIIYNRKNNTAFCTRCEEKYSLAELEIQNNTKAEHMKEHQMCIRCKTWMKQISNGMSRNGKSFRMGTEIMQPCGSGVVIREFAAYREFASAPNRAGRTSRMHTTLREVHRYVITREEYREYETEPVQIASGRWKEQWVDRTTSNFKKFAPREGKYYPQDIPTMLNGTCMAYEGLGELVKKYVDKHPYETGMERITKLAIQKRYIEQMVKIGLKQIAEKLLWGQGRTYIKVNEKETALTKILGINKGELRILRNVKDQTSTLAAIQIIKKSERSTTEELIREVTKAVQDKSQPYQLIPFLRENKNAVRTLRYCSRKEVSMNDFLDHIELMEKLQIPMKKGNMYPENFAAVHQQEIEDMLKNNDIVSKETKKVFSETYKNWNRIIKMYKVITSGYGYKIVMPPEPVDIKIEGRTLHHCVGGYTESAARGNTLIFYVRKEENKRLYTAEYRNRKLIQIRAVCNQKPEEDARKLAEQFARELAAAEEKEAKKKKQIVIAV